VSEDCLSNPGLSLILCSIENPKIPL
jgi:hypothetical protein